MSLQPGLHRNLSGGCAGFLLPLPPRGPGFPAALLWRTRRRERRHRNPGAGWGAGWERSCGHLLGLSAARGDPSYSEPGVGTKTVPAEE